MSDRSPVLVTGATGFLGSHLLPLLLAEKTPVRVLSRRPAPELSARGVEVVEGEIESETALRSALAGVRRVFHLAGRVSRDPEASADLHRVHVEGTRTLATEARREGVARIVLVSTSGTIAVSRDPEPDCDETRAGSDRVDRRLALLPEQVAPGTGAVRGRRRYRAVVVVNSFPACSDPATTGCPPPAMCSASSRTDPGDSARRVELRGCPGRGRGRAGRDGQGPRRRALPARRAQLELRRVLRATWRSRGVFPDPGSALRAGSIPRAPR